MRTPKESEYAKGTHVLERTDRETSEIMGKNARERRTLAFWRAQSDGHVRTQKEDVRGHSRTGGRTSEDTE
jgi:hypothetical protein